MHHYRFLSLTLFACSTLLLSACDSAIDKSPIAKQSAVDPTVSLTILPLGNLQKNRTIPVEAKLTHIKEKYILYPEDLKSTHNVPLQLLIIDPTLTDYQRIHPTPITPKGLYSFRFTPKLNSGYRVWAQATPTETNITEFAYANMGKPKGRQINHHENHTSTINGYRFTLTLHTKPLQDNLLTTNIDIADRKGQPIIPDTSGYLFGFYDDFRTVLHSAAINHKTTFQLRPERAGFIKLFVHLTIKGKDYTVPFGITISPAK